MFLPYTVDVPMERIPIANWLLMGVTVLASLFAWVEDSHRPRRLDSLQFPPHIERKLDDLEARGAPDEEFTKVIQQFAADLLAPTGALQPRNFSVLQLFTHQFVHGDILHLAGNMLFLFVFGNAVNAKLGHVLFLIGYLLLGALAGLGWLMFGNGMPMIGASGAIMGIAGIFLVLFPRNEVSVLYWWTRGGGSFNIPAFWLLLAYLVLDLIGVLRADQGIAYVSHLTGTLFGAAFAIGLLQGGVVESTSYEENLLQVFGWTKKAKGRRLRDI